MMTLSQFKKAGKLFLRRRSNPLIHDLDKLLDIYHDPRSTPNKKLKVLVMIYLLCKHYEVTKPDGKRGESVSDLKRSAASEINSQGFRSGLLTRAGGGGRRSNLPAVAGSASLHSRYQIESVMPQQKSVNKLGLKTGIPVFGMSTVLERYQEILGGMPGADAEYMAACSGRHLKFEDWALQKWDQKSMAAKLDELYDLWGDKMFKGTEMNYLGGDERVEYVVQMSAAGLTAMANGRPTQALSCKHPNFKNTGCIYAMDLSERLFVLRGPALNQGQWNHSSVLSGKAVICAGELAALNGRLVYINNSSGHYKPDSEALSNCLRVLSNSNVPLGQTNIFDKARGNYYVGYNAFRAGQAANPDPDLGPIFNQIP